jgi:hypothetical protein
MAITKEIIWHAAQALDDAGEKPTLANVRKKVGGGSFTTISDAMTEWHATRPKVSVKHDPVPEKVSDAAHEFTAMLWRVAHELADGRLQAEHQALEEARLKFEEEKAEAAAFADQLSQELELERQKYLDAKKESDANAAALSNAQSKFDQEHARAERLQAVSDEREKSIETLKEELRQVRLDKEREFARLETALKGKRKPA